VCGELLISPRISNSPHTPDGFVFNIKLFALMTQHPAEMSRLPKQLREMVAVEERSNRQLMPPSKEVVDMAFQMFWNTTDRCENPASLECWPSSSRCTSRRRARL